MRTALFGALLAISAISAASPAVAQQRVDIRFEPGRSGTTINGTITGRQYIDYVLRARGGQRMNVRLNVEERPGLIEVENGESEPLKNQFQTS